jgi:hypothetical protein
MAASEWIQELRLAEQKSKEDQRIADELRLRNDRMLCAKASQAWEALREQLKSDCAELSDRCEVTTDASGHLILSGKRLPLRCVGMTLNLDGHFIRAAKSYSEDGIIRHGDSIERIRMELQSDDSILFVGDRRKMRTVSDLSCYLVKYAINAAD